MGLTRLAIRRPVTIGMLILAMVLVGAVAHQKLNVQLLPKLDQPAVTVVTTYNGATAEDMEQLVTKPIEDAVATSAASTTSPPPRRRASRRSWSSSWTTSAPTPPRPTSARR